jgi:hypothetical protein
MKRTFLWSARFASPAAVRAGLGLTCRTTSFDPLPALDHGLLPDLAAVSVILAHRADPAESLRSLIGFIKVAVESA